MAEVAPTPWTASAHLRSQFHLVHRRMLPSLAWCRGDAAIELARLVLCEDFTVSGFVLPRPPLALSIWRGRTGLSELPRLAAPIDWRRWAARVQLDLEVFPYYAEAVYSATDDALADQLPDWSVYLLHALLLTLCTAHPSERVTPGRDTTAAVVSRLAIPRSRSRSSARTAPAAIRTFQSRPPSSRRFTRRRRSPEFGLDVCASRCDQSAR